MPSTRPIRAPLYQYVGIVPNREKRFFILAESSQDARKQLRKALGIGRLPSGTQCLRIPHILNEQIGFGN